MRLDRVDFSCMPFWVQIYNVLVERFDEENGLDLGRRIGKPLEVDTVPFFNNNGAFLRVKIELNTRFPLPTGIDFLHDNGEVDIFKSSYKS